MFTLFLRAVLLYGVMILTMRCLGKRQLGEFQPFEFALTILLADIISAPIESVSTPLFYGLLPVTAVITVHGLLTMLCMKSDRIRAIVSGKPAVVISRGRIDRGELNRLCLSLSDLLEGLRGAGYLDVAEVGTALIEANGSISAFPSAGQRQPKAAELEISPGYEGLPLILVMDGRVQKNNLKKSGKGMPWLNGLLAARGFSAAGVYLASLDTQGRMTVQTIPGELLRFQAMPPEEVGW